MAAVRGTWQTGGGGGPDLAPAATALVAAVLVFGAVSWLAARAWWILGGLAVLFALAGVGAVFAWHAVRRMKAADQAQIATIRTLRAGAFPQATQRTVPPAVENHYHVHHHYAEAPAPARVIRAIPGTAGDAITKGEKS